MTKSNTIFRLRRDASEGTSYVNVIGDVDVSTANDMRNQLFSALTDKPRTLVVRLKHVPYMDSAGVAVMLELLKEMRRRKGKVMVLEPSPSAKKALDIVDLPTLVDCYDSIEECAMCMRVSTMSVKTQVLSKEELQAAGIVRAE